MVFVHFYREPPSSPLGDARYALVREVLLKTQSPQEKMLGYLSDEPLAPGETEMQRMTEMRRFLDAQFALAPYRLRYAESSPPLIVSDFSSAAALQDACARYRLVPISDPTLGVALLVHASAP